MRWGGLMLLALWPGVDAAGVTGLEYYPSDEAVEASGAFTPPTIYPPSYTPVDVPAAIRAENAILGDDGLRSVGCPYFSMQTAPFWMGRITGGSVCANLSLTLTIHAVPQIASADEEQAIALLVPSGSFPPSERLTTAAQALAVTPDGRLVWRPDPRSVVGGIAPVLATPPGVVRPGQAIQVDLETAIDDSYAGYNFGRVSRLAVDGVTVVSFAYELYTPEAELAVPQGYRWIFFASPDGLSRAEITIHRVRVAMTSAFLSDGINGNYVAGQSYYGVPFTGFPKNVQWLFSPDAAGAVLGTEESGSAAPNMASAWTLTPRFLLPSVALGAATDPWGSPPGDISHCWRRDRGKGRNYFGQGAGAGSFTKSGPPGRTYTPLARP
jgi:hypothetical protein